MSKKRSWTIVCENLAAQPAYTVSKMPSVLGATKNPDFERGWTFTGHGTQEQALAVRDAIWDQNNGAYCSLVTKVER